MRAAGADVKEIQQQLGHRNATVTLNTYTHLFEGDLASMPNSWPNRVLASVAHPPDSEEEPV